MPQASDELRARWWPPDDDGKPWRHLRPNFDLNAGGRVGYIAKRDPSYQPTEDDYSAIDFLVWEWDYCYEGVE